MPAGRGLSFCSVVFVSPFKVPACVSSFLVLHPWKATVTGENFVVLKWAGFDIVLVKVFAVLADVLVFLRYKDADLCHNLFTSI